MVTVWPARRGRGGGSSVAAITPSSAVADTASAATAEWLRLLWLDAEAVASTTGDSRLVHPQIPPLTLSAAADAYLAALPAWAGEATAKTSRWLLTALTRAVGRGAAVAARRRQTRSRSLAAPSAAAAPSRRSGWPTLALRKYASDIPYIDADADKTRKPQRTGLRRP